jgi:hypothetical protein
MTGQPGNGGGSCRQGSKGVNGRVARPVAGLVAVDLLLICAGAAAEISPLVIVVAHSGLIAGCAWWFRPARAHDCTLWTFSLMLVLIAGPLGGAGIILLSLAIRFSAPQRDVLEAWYDWLSGEERPDPTRRLYEAILTGRELKPPAQGPRSFASVLEHGALGEEQALLGHIGLKYHHDYFPLLCSALRSTQSPVRAQAAAVFVKLKEQFRRRLHDDRHRSREARRSGDAPAMLACARSMLACAESGFLDRSEVREALAEAKALSLTCASSDAADGEPEMILCRVIAATGEDDGLLDRLLAAAPNTSPQMRQLLARCLVATRRHADLHRLLFAGKDRAARAQTFPVLLVPESAR